MSIFFNRLQRANYFKHWIPVSEYLAYSYIAHNFFFEMLQFSIKIFQAFMTKTWGKDCSFPDKALLSHAKYKILGSVYPVSWEYYSANAIV